MILVGDGGQLDIEGSAELKSAAVLLGVSGMDLYNCLTIKTVRAKSSSYTTQQTAHQVCGNMGSLELEGKFAILIKPEGSLVSFLLVWPFSINHCSNPLYPISNYDIFCRRTVRSMSSAKVYMVGWLCI